MKLGESIAGMPGASLIRQATDRIQQSRALSSVRHKMPTPRAVRSDESQARILCYHRISDNPNPNLATYAMRPADFRAQMQWLKDNDWNVMALPEVLAAFREERPLHKAIVLTFDDGYQDLVDQALPILRDFGYPATAFIVTDYIGTEAGWDARYGGAMAPLANLEGIRELEAAGWEIGHHTRTHPRLTDLDDEALEKEIAGGKVELERLLGHGVESFAYPFGINDLRVRQATEQAGFPVGFALNSPIATSHSPHFQIERVCVLREHTLRDFQMLVWFGRDVRGSLRHVTGGPARVIHRALDRSASPVG